MKGCLAHIDSTYTHVPLLPSYKKKKNCLESSGFPSLRRFVRLEHLPPPPLHLFPEGRDYGSKQFTDVLGKGFHGMCAP